MMLCAVLLAACSRNAAVENQSRSSVSQPKQSQQGAEKMSVLEKAKQENPDTAAWLRIPGTEINSPVMQTANNEDYLKKTKKANMMFGAAILPIITAC